MVKMLNVPDDKFNKLYEILEAVRSINELKVQLDMNGFNYDKKNELSFLVWVWSLVSSSSLSKPIAHYDDSWLKKNLSEEQKKNPITKQEITNETTTNYELIDENSSSTTDEKVKEDKKPEVKKEETKQEDKK